MSDDPKRARSWFYVGYLPLPSGLGVVLIAVVASLIAGLGGVVAAVALTQRDPGPAVWEATRQTFVGTIHTTPYPILVLDVPNDAGGTLLIVEQGKFAADDRFVGLDGQRVSVVGTVLTRDTRQLLELTADPVRVVPGAGTGELTRQPIGPVRLAGEIMDSKCYLGAMKPGDGATHRACASLCIAGGIPPMLVTRDAAGAASYYLLTDEAGGPANGLVAGAIGVPVEVSGRLERLGDELVVIRVGASGIRKL